MAGKMVSRRKVDIDLINADGGTQARASMDQQAIGEYADDMRRGDEFPAIELMFDGDTYWLVDGFHRYYAAKRASKKQMVADVRQGTQREAWLASRGVNKKNSLRRSNADKRYSVESVLRDEECVHWTDGRIADLCGVDAKTVSSVRAELVATQEIPELDERIGLRGGVERTINVANIGGKSKHETDQSDPAADQTWYERWQEYKSHDQSKVYFATIGDTNQYWLAFEGDAVKVAHLLGLHRQKFMMPTDAFPVRECVLLEVGDPLPAWWEGMYAALDQKMHWYPEWDAALLAIAANLTVSHVGEAVQVEETNDITPPDEDAPISDEQPTPPAPQPETEPDLSTLNWLEAYEAIRAQHPGETVFIENPTKPYIWVAVGAAASAVARRLDIRCWLMWQGETEDHLSTAMLRVGEGGERDRRIAMLESMIGRTYFYQDSSEAFLEAWQRIVTSSYADGDPLEEKPVETPPPSLAGNVPIPGLPPTQNAPEPAEPPVEQDALGAAMRGIQTLVPQIIALIDVALERTEDDHGKLVARLLKRTSDYALVPMLVLVQKIIDRPTQIVHIKEAIHNTDNEIEMRNIVQRIANMRVNDAAVDRELDDLRTLAQAKIQEIKVMV